MPDLKASVSFTADGTTKKYYFNFDYINPEYIKVNVGGTELSYPSDYSVIDRAVELAEVPAKDMLIQVYRQTPSDRLIEWADGAFIKAAQMSLSDLQQLHLIEESQDYIILNCISSYPDGKNFNALGHRIINVADPVDTQDAVTKHYMESVQDGFVQRNQEIETHVQQMQTDVTQKQQAAAQSASNAATSETNAAESEDAALASKQAAAASESNAATSEGNAKASELAAKTSETNAKTSETNAKTSETNAKTSELNAASSETNAAASESAAAALETNAANSELMAQKWAEDSESPDGRDDTQSNTGKTQSARGWALQAKNEATSFQDFVGATDSEDGFAGRVPAPVAGDQGKFLCGDGSWQVARMTDLEIVKITNPVGTIRAFNNGFNPNTTWVGTTWKQFGQGRVLVGAGADGGTNFALGAKGGEETHQLSVGEMPSHGHGATITNAGSHSHTRNHMSGIGDNSMTIPSTEKSKGLNMNNNVSIPNLNSAGVHTHTVTIATTGSSLAHNNMPPYVVVNYWVRTA